MCNYPPSKIWLASRAIGKRSREIHTSVRFLKIDQNLSSVTTRKTKRKKKKGRGTFLSIWNSRVSSAFIVPDSLVFARRFALRLANKLGCLARARSPLVTRFSETTSHNTRHLLLPSIIGADAFGIWAEIYTDATVPSRSLWMFAARFSNYRSNVPNVSSKYLSSINSSYYERPYFPRPLYRSVQWNSTVNWHARLDAPARRIHENQSFKSWAS